METKKKEYLQKLKNGEKNAFEGIFNAYFPRLYFFALGYLPDEAVTEDIVQDVFVDLWLQRKKLPPDSNLNAWLYSVTKNKTMKYLKHLKVENNYKKYSTAREKEMIINRIALSKLDSNKITEVEIKKIIDSTLKGLPEKCREVFQMNRFEDKKYAEIANELKISLKTVETHMSKALKMFKINLKEYINT